MNITEEKQVVETKEVIVGKKCDYCGKAIAPSPKYGRNTYYRIKTGHWDWANDSMDSIEYFDACSRECANLALENYYKKESDTAYIEINKEAYWLRN